MVKVLHQQSKGQFDKIFIKIFLQKINFNYFFSLNPSKNCRRKGASRFQRSINIIIIESGFGYQTYFCLHNLAS